jgi:hypothetical protein
MTGLSRFGFGLATLTVAALATPVLAQSDGPRHLVPGSVMIFPVFDARDGFDTIITVTNTNSDRRVADNRFRHGDVSVHFVYIDGETWLENDVDVFLTPSDTYSVLASEQAVDNMQGWLWVEARDPERPDCAIDFDFLIGSAILTSLDFNLEWEYAPYTFRALPEEREMEGEDETDSEFGYSGNDHAYVEDCDNPDGFLNFDGIEYDYFPRYIYIDQYFGEGSPAELPTATFANSAYLLSTEMLGTAGTILFYNNNEREFSRGFRFDCWTCRPLTGFSAQATQANTRIGYDSTELKGIPYGWLRFDSPTDPILGAFMQQISKGGLDFVAGDTMHFSGTREAMIQRVN